MRAAKPAAGDRARKAARAASAAVLAGAALSCPAPALADTFVPADPPARVADCVAIAGDVTAAGRAVPDKGYAVTVSEAGTPWRAVAGGGGCPRLAAAPDGTAALATGPALAVRRPHAAFGPPVKLAFPATDVAAAANGWAAAIGERILGGTLGTEVAATIVAPDGSARTTVLEPSTTKLMAFGNHSSPRIAIDAFGTATATWTRADASGDYLVRFARTPPGGPWEKPLTVARNTLGELPETDAQADVALAGAHRLLTWADGEGIRASLDGGPPETLTTERDAGSPVAALGPDGSAVVAYGATPARVLENDRAAGGGWSAPRSFAGPSTPPLGSDSGPPANASLEAALGPDGRAAVMWQSFDAVGFHVRAAAGRAGGAWERAATISAPTRDTADASLALDDTGVPRLAWIETVRDGPPNRLRGARLAAGGPEDVTPPGLTAGLPARTPRTRTGAFQLAVPVRCSEDCDVRVRLLRGGRELAAAVQAVAAGRRTTVRLRAPEYLELDVLAHPRHRHPRLEVMASDRAGNVARRARTLAVRVVDRPLRSFEVPLDYDFAMFSKAGNRAVAQLVNQLIDGLAGKRFKSERALDGFWERGAARIAAVHDEIYDTEVGDAVYEVIYVPCARAGFDAESVLSG